MEGTDTSQYNAPIYLMKYSNKLDLGTDSLLSLQVPLKFVSFFLDIEYIALIIVG